MHWQKAKWQNKTSGQAMVEFAIVFPVLFLLILLIIQLTMMCIAKQMVNYAAYCSARSACVWMGHSSGGSGQVDLTTAKKKAKRAAAIACIPISPDYGLSGQNLPNLIDELAEYGSRFVFSSLLTTVKLFDGNGSEITSSDIEASSMVNQDVTAEVEHEYVLRIPLVNKIFYYLCSTSPVAEGQRALHGEPEQSLSMRPYKEYIDLEAYGYSFYRLPMLGRCTLTVEGKTG